MNLPLRVLKVANVRGIFFQENVILFHFMCHHQLRIRMVHEKQQYEKVKLRAVPRYFSGLEIVTGVFGACYSEGKGPDWEKR